MKKHLNMAGSLLVPALVIPLALVGCGEARGGASDGAIGGLSPAEVAKRYLNAIEKGDMAAAGKYLAKKDIEEGLKNHKAQLAKHGGIDYFTGEVSISDKRASVRFKYKDGKGQDVDLVKVDGRWMVKRI